MSVSKAEAETLVLETLNKGSSIKSHLEFAKTHGIDAVDLESVLRSLITDDFVATTANETTVWGLTEEGQSYAKNGMPEVQLFHKIPDAGLPLADVKSVCQALGVNEKGAQGALMKAKWATTDKKAGLIKKAVDASAVVDTVCEELRKAQSTGAEPANVKDLKKRKLVESKVIRDFVVSKGASYQLVRKKDATDITEEMLKNGTWATEKFKPYNLDALGTKPSGGTLHPLMKVRKEFREIFLELGFEEMPTNKWVESSFWNFDALFQPQQHPARDAHDTFFMKTPSTTLNIPQDYLERVWDVHQNGGYGSVGYNYEWSEEETRKNILRTHTTAVSSRMLYKLAQDYKKEGTFTPKKYFSIDRVFRNEALDKTHLAEFHQIEGLVCDRGITLGDLIGTIKQFFQKIGIPDVKFKPAYNPYTEPSMEIFGYSPDLNKWMELGNSGVFRPEMLQPMGLPEDVSVISVGFGTGASHDDPVQVWQHPRPLRAWCLPRLHCRESDVQPVRRRQLELVGRPG